MATIRGIPVRVHGSFLVLMLWIGWTTASTSGLRAAAAEQGLILAVFGCVALHELGHAAAARRQGIPINGITLYPFGGVARMARQPPRGIAEVRVAVAGPAVNLAIAVVVFVVVGGDVGISRGTMLQRFLGMLFWANLILAGFNLLPAFPLDGGRILRGLLSMKIGWVRATVWAASIGQVAAVVLIATGLTRDLWLVLAGLLILPAANAELRYALTLRQFVGRRVGDLVRKDIIEVGETTTISEAAEMSVVRPLADFVVTTVGRPVAYLSAARLWSLVRSDRPGTSPVRDTAEPLSRSIAAGVGVEDAVRLFAASGPVIAPVTGDDGELLGVVARGDLERAAQLARHYQ